MFVGVQRHLRTRCEDGVALLVILALLGAMTVVAVAGLNMTVLQTRMANNALSRAQVFQLAEAVLQRCEKHVLDAAHQDAQVATGIAAPEVRQAFRRGEEVRPVSAELFTVAFGEIFPQADDGGYRLGCLVENKGLARIIRPGCSLRIGNGIPNCMYNRYALTVRVSRPASRRSGERMTRPLVLLRSGLVD